MLRLCYFCRICARVYAKSRRSLSLSRRTSCKLPRSRLLTRRKLLLTSLVFRCIKDTTPVLSISPQSIASLAAYNSLTPDACFRKLKKAFKDMLGFKLVFDTTFARHISLLEGQQEFYEKSPSYKGKERASNSSEISAAFPLLASACPGWICYAEKTHGELLPYISNVKSPQQVMGTLIKDWIAPKLRKRCAESAADFARKGLR